jgi:DNA (cytosine-5)-methyltransferase 1
MLQPQYILPIWRELVIDLFAGGGGASTGIEQAIGRHVDIAVNHDREAVSLHEANHPQTRHFCSDVFEVDPLTVTNGQRVGLLWASPDCKHFSKAKGGKPVSKKIRGLAWVVVKWAKLVRPRVICLENVEEFQTWGPLADGRPCPERKGRTFALWKKQLKNLGYKIEHRELRACDYGAPTIRKRLFLVARCDGLPIVWTEPTHAQPDAKGKVPKDMKPWRTAAECIDWSIPAPSIFERDRPLADATCRRIAKGIMRYVVNSAEPFIVTNTTGHPGARATEPLRTITTGGHHALVTPFLTEHANASSPRTFRADEPLRTQVAQVKGGHFALVSAFLVKYYGNEVDGLPVTDPLHTIPTRDRFDLVMVKGEPYVISDVGLRMLTPRELYRAQGFPESYIIERGANGKPLTKTAQVRMCGNSVCPPIARAIVAANYSEQQVLKEAA